MGEGEQLGKTFPLGCYRGQIGRWLERAMIVERNAMNRWPSAPSVLPETVRMKFTNAYKAIPIPNPSLRPIL